MKAFLSHSHVDKASATTLATKLIERGVDVWYAPFEIKPGDSIVDKIFEEGLKDCKMFIVLLTPASVSSAWVKHELDTAVVHKLSGMTRVIPVVGEPCDIPVALRALLRLDMAEGLEYVADKLVSVFQDRDKKPALGPARSTLVIDVPGMTRTAAQVAVLLVGTMEQPGGRPQAYTGKQVAEGLGLNPEEVNDAVEELDALGLVRKRVSMGTAPFSFLQVEPSASLPFQLRNTGVLSYDPEQDVKEIAAMVVETKTIEAKELARRTELSPVRINNAVAFLEYSGLAQVRRYLGTGPFDFGYIEATGATRRFVSENS